MNRKILKIDFHAESGIQSSRTSIPSNSRKDLCLCWLHQQSTEKIENSPLQFPGFLTTVRHQERTSYSSKPTSPFLSSKHCSTVQRAPKASTISSKEVPAGAKTST